MSQMRRLILRAGLAGSTAWTILFMPDDQFKTLIASLLSSALGTVLSSLAGNWVNALFGLATTTTSGA